MAANPPAAASSSTAPAPAAAPGGARVVPTEVLAAFSGALAKGGNPNGLTDPEQVAQSLLMNMPTLVKLAQEGKLSDAQTAQLKTFLKIYQQHQKNTQNAAAAQAASGQAGAATQAAPAANVAANALKRKSPPTDLAPRPQEQQPIAPLQTTNPGPQAWPNSYGQRPTLTGGLVAGPISGTPSQIQRVPEDPTLLGDTAPARTGFRKGSLNDPTMRKTIQDLVGTIDPNVRVDPDVEDLLLEIADEFIDSVTNFGCRLARHRGGDTLEVRDLQLHLERNHNIRIPGFTSDISVAGQNATSAQAAGAAAKGAGKKGGAGTHQSTLRSARLAAVHAAKATGRFM